MGFYPVILLADYFFLYTSAYVYIHVYILRVHTSLVKPRCWIGSHKSRNDHVPRENLVEFSSQRAARRRRALFPPACGGHHGVVVQGGGLASAGDSRRPRLAESGSD